MRSHETRTVFVIRSMGVSHVAYKRDFRRKKKILQLRCFSSFLFFSINRPLIKPRSSSFSSLSLFRAVLPVQAWSTVAGMLAYWYRGGIYGRFRLLLTCDILIVRPPLATWIWMWSLITHCLFIAHYLFTGDYTPLFTSVHSWTLKAPWSLMTAD